MISIKARLITIKHTHDSYTSLRIERNTPVLVDESEAEFKLAEVAVDLLCVCWPRGLDSRHYLVFIKTRLVLHLSVFCNLRLYL